MISIRHELNTLSIYEDFTLSRSSGLSPRKKNVTSVSIFSITSWMTRICTWQQSMTTKEQLISKTFLWRTSTQCIGDTDLTRSCKPRVSDDHNYAQCSESHAENIDNDTVLSDERKDFINSKVWYVVTQRTGDEVFDSVCNVVELNVSEAWRRTCKRIGERITCKRFYFTRTERTTRDIRTRDIRLFACARRTTTTTTRTSNSRSRGRSFCLGWSWTETWPHLHHPQKSILLQNVCTLTEDDVQHDRPDHGGDNSCATAVIRESLQVQAQDDLLDLMTEFADHVNVKGCRNGNDDNMREWWYFGIWNGKRTEAQKH